ncbi:MAG: N-acetyltransferase [Bradyrhizobium sp.]|nr:N-acetyltransferase [Bradyrhizobium sp.]
MNIRLETSGDVAGIRDIVCAVFDGTAEADLIENLRRDGDLLLSMVAENASRLVGHIGFSRLWIEQAGQRTPGVSLAPLSVGADYRRRGVGAALVEKGHAHLLATGESIVFVLGAPAYYGRFNYSVPAAAGFDCVYAGQHFQVLGLTEHAPKAGAITYAGAFGKLQ